MEQFGRYVCAVDVCASCPFYVLIKRTAVLSLRSLMTSGVTYAVMARVSGLKTRWDYGNGGVWIVRSRLSRTTQEGIFMREYVPSMLITLAYSKILLGPRTLYLWTLKKSIAPTRMNHDGHPLNSGLQPAACSQRDTPCFGQRLVASASITLLS